MNGKPFTIAELLNLKFEPEIKTRRQAKVLPMSTPFGIQESDQPSRKYEYQVFNYLLENKDTLGIQTVFKFENLRVDGAILLADGRRLAVEVKFRMNWNKALQAGYEFRRFLLSDEANANPVTGALVLFEKFQGEGWQGQPKCRLLENGWNEWYRSHSQFEGYRLDLVRFCHGSPLEHYNLAKMKRIVANMQHFSKDELNKIITAVSSHEPPS